MQIQPVQISFAKGLDTKTDSKQVQIGNFLRLENAVFTTGGRLTKRNGFPKITSLPSANSVYLTTFFNNLTAIGTSVQAYSDANASWVSKGNLVPLTLSVMPTARSSINQVQCDSAIAPNGLLCTVYTENNNGTLSYHYVIANSETGQNIVNQSLIPAGSGAITGSARVFVLGGYFIIAFTNTISATAHLQYVAVSLAIPTTVTAPADLAANYAPTNALSWDGVVVGTNLYFAYYTTSGGNAVHVNYLQASLNLATSVTIAHVATNMSVTADLTNASNPVIYVSFYDSASSTGYSAAYNTALQNLMTATEMITSGTVYNLTSSAQNGIVTIAYEVANVYSYASSIVTNFLNSVYVTLPATVTTGTVGSTVTFSRSVGLASKSFIMNGTIYVLAEYASTLQSTYFLMDLSGNVISRFAYENGGAVLSTGAGYLPLGLPQAQVIGSIVYIAYLYKDLIESQSTTGLVQSIGQAGLTNIYSQTGVSLASISFDSSTLMSSEIGGNLNITGGMLWAFDGSSVTEQGFSLFPDNIVLANSSTSSGSIGAGTYYYQITYEWTDAKGNIFRSAPSVPVSITVSGSTNTITVNIPYLRLTYKSGVKIQIYRWSQNQQEYYQVTSITAPTLNVPTSDSLAYPDTLNDTSILGNNLIYTTGSVVEDVSGPACVSTALYDNRLWLLTAEDRNLFYFSKQVIEGTPVELSDLFTYYVAPTSGAQGSTGPAYAIAPLGSTALIVFKKDALYYIQGTGPDNTGASNQYSEPVYIPSTVGTINHASIVVTQDGLQFQSDKGIWLLSYGFGVEYIGAPAEGFNDREITSATAVPATTQVRYTLSDGDIIMYDYYYQQWGTFTGIPAILSSTLYQGMHTLLCEGGLVLQEEIGTYLDNGNPVLMGFLTGFIQLAGLSGYQRLLEIQLTAEYYSPHLLQCLLGYDYAPLSEQAVIDPINYTGPYGSDDLYGQTTPFGGPGSNEPWRIQNSTQKCRVFQVQIQEFFDPSFGVSSGEGFTLSAMTCVVGVNRGYRPVPAVTTTGTN